MLLDVAEARNKLLVGTLQRILGIQLVKPGRIDDREEEVAKLIGRALLVVAGKLGLQLSQLLVDLLPDILLLCQSKPTLRALSCMR